MQTECSIPQCQRRVVARGWCPLHYDRWRRNGDPLLTHRSPNLLPGAICSGDDCAKPVVARGLCTGHYQRWAKYGTLSLPSAPSFAERFWRFVDKSGDCWLWLGATNDGYGVMRIPGTRRNKRATHIAYELSFGPVPEGMMLCHHCDNPPCVRPIHLFPGTNADNQRDYVAKQRAAATA
jgi:hypothetical protein